MTITQYSSTFQAQIVIHQYNGDDKSVLFIVLIVAAIFYHDVTVNFLLDCSVYISWGNCNVIVISLKVVVMIIGILLLFELSHYTITRQLL